MYINWYFFFSFFSVWFYTFFPLNARSWSTAWGKSVLPPSLFGPCFIFSVLCCNQSPILSFIIFFFSCFFCFFPTLNSPVVVWTSIVCGSWSWQKLSVLLWLVLPHFPLLPWPYSNDCCDMDNNICIILSTFLIACTLFTMLFHCHLLEGLAMFVVLIKQYWNYLGVFQILGLYSQQEKSLYNSFSKLFENNEII